MFSYITNRSQNSIDFPKKVSLVLEVKIVKENIGQLPNFVVS